MIVCLLPARDAASDIAGYLRSVEPLADAVVALDDGSRDDTADRLEASPQVRLVLRNPPREGHAAWDDGANRARLLEAAGELDPDWVVFLDADERLDPEDGEALRGFLLGDGIRGCAYGLQLFRAWNDGVVPEPTYVFRAFAYEPGQRLPAERLHFSPVPASIPPRAWIRTTIRVRHLDSPDRLERRRARYLDADPQGEWETGPGPRLEPPERLVPWAPRPAGLPVLALGGEAERLALARADGRPDRSARLACLLPARDCAPELPAYLEAAGQFADAVIALDDGSTDGTGELLEASPIVEALIRNPRRESYAGWDDRANRQRLLDAAAAQGYDWVLFLDADERIDMDDASALRRLVDLVAERDRAYGFRVFRMIDDRHYDRASLWTYRLFAACPGQRLAGGRLHLVPVPESIPRSRWLRTTIRIKHLASLSADRRAARYRKYEEADPERRFQSDYTDLLAPPGRPRPWPKRPPGFPLLADPEQRGRGAELDLTSLDPDAPGLSAIVIARDDEDRIERCVRSVVDQECPVPFEVIVVTSGSDRTAAIVRERFPSVTLIELRQPALPGAARNAGLAAARGEYVSFPGSHVELEPGSLAARVLAHERGYAMVTGSIVNASPSRSGWASYFLDHSGALPGRPSGELSSPPVHCSYSREALLEVGGFPEDIRAGEDTVVNRELWRRGYGAYRERRIVLAHRSPCTNPWRLARHHFVRGRALTQIFLSGGGTARLAPFVAGYLRHRLADTEQRVLRWGEDLEPQYRRARPLVAVGAISAWAGMWVELLRPRRRAGRTRRRAALATPT